MECAGYQLAANTHTRGLPLGQGRWQGLHLQPVGMYPQQAGPCRALAAGAAQTWTVRGLWGTGRRCGRDQGMEPPTRAKGNLQVLPRGSPGAAAAACLLPWPGPQGALGQFLGTGPSRPLHLHLSVVVMCLRSPGCGQGTGLPSLCLCRP